MPIIETKSSSEPLSQGDILSGIALSVTSSDGGEEPFVQTQKKLCLVLSRPCNGIRGKTLVVASIEKFNEKFPSHDDFAAFDRFLRRMRDGEQTIDLMYLGQIPNYSGRFCCRFDSLHTIEVPTDEHRATFIDNHRKLSLHPDFVRDLHVRLTRAFASLGFEDINWMSTPDLKLGVSIARKDLANLDAKIESAKVASEELEAGGKSVSDAQRKAISELEAKPCVPI